MVFPEYSVEIVGIVGFYPRIPSSGKHVCWSMDIWGVLCMREIGRIGITFLEDRSVIKCRVNFIRRDKIVGFMKPLRRLC